MMVEYVECVCPPQTSTTFTIIEKCWKALKRQELLTPGLKTKTTQSDWTAKTEIMKS